LVFRSKKMNVFPKSTMSEISIIQRGSTSKKKRGRRGYLIRALFSFFWQTRQEKIFFCTRKIFFCHKIFFVLFAKSDHPPPTTPPMGGVGGTQKKGGIPKNVFFTAIIGSPDPPFKHETLFCSYSRAAGGVRG
jgi:hypothetical protein